MTCAMTCIDGSGKVLLNHHGSSIDMFRSIIKENQNELKSISSSVKRINIFQHDIDNHVKKILGQRVGEVKRTLPTTRTKMEECIKKVGDIDLCQIILGKYHKFYAEMCQASPAVCDDYQPPVVQSRFPIEKDGGSVPAVMELKKRPIMI